MTADTRNGKLLIFSAPSGAGKTTIVKHLLNTYSRLSFSVSACSRPRRENETHGKDYWFLTAGEFRNKIKEGAFVEWEEVYPGLYYGTLHAEIERIWKEGKHVVFDVDVKGGLNLKKKFGERALAVFVSPPSLEVLEERLRNRSTESEEKIRERIGKAAWEMKHTSSFDHILLNDQLSRTLMEAETIVEAFTGIRK